jgi:hypothetical protein
MHLINHNKFLAGKEVLILPVRRGSCPRRRNHRALTATRSKLVVENRMSTAQLLINGRTATNHLYDAPRWAHLNGVGGYLFGGAANSGCAERTAPARGPRSMSATTPPDQRRGEVDGVTVDGPASVVVGPTTIAVSDPGRTATTVRLTIERRTGVPLVLDVAVGGTGGATQTFDRTW